MKKRPGKDTRRDEKTVGKDELQVSEGRNGKRLTSDSRKEGKTVGKKTEHWN